jgi:hypothetical protein
VDDFFIRDGKQAGESLAGSLPLGLDLILVRKRHQPMEILPVFDVTDLEPGLFEFPLVERRIRLQEDQALQQPFPLQVQHPVPAQRFCVLVEICRVSRHNHPFC